MKRTFSVIPAIAVVFILTLCGYSAGRPALGLGVRLKAPAVNLNFATSEYATGREPQGIAVADFNGDGFSDLAVANFGDNTLSVLMGNGDGTFQPAVSYPTSSSLPVWVATGDFNGDGKPDIVVAVSEGLHPGISVFINHGDGTFQPQVYYPGSAPASVVVGDFNGDGKLDIITDGLDIYRGNGDGTFQPAIHTPKSIFYLAVGDLNHDGNLDLIGTDESEHMRVALGNGDGTFQPTRSYPTNGYQPNHVALGDFNGDGNLDAAVTNLCGSDIECESEGTTSILLGKGDGTFGPPTVYTTGGAPVWVATSDFNGDGKVDLALTDTEEDAQVLLGNGDGTFQPPLNFQIFDGPWGIIPGYFKGNGQGSADLAVTIVGNNSVAVMLNDAATHIKFSTNPNPSTDGETVTFTANLAATVNGQPTPTGTVQFASGSHKGNATLDSSGVATFSTSFNKSGKYKVTAAYSGDANFNPNQAQPIRQAVNP